MKNFAGVMKLAFAIGLSGITISTPSWAQPRGETENDLLKIQDEWAKARVENDVPYLERLYAQELRIQAMDGSVVEREADIANFATGALQPDYVRDEDMEVSVYDNTAIVTGIENMAGT